MNHLCCYTIALNSLGCLSLFLCCFINQMFSLTPRGPAIGIKQTYLSYMCEAKENKWETLQSNISRRCHQHKDGFLSNSLTWVTTSCTILHLSATDSEEHNNSSGVMFVPTWLIQVPYLLSFVFFVFGGYSRPWEECCSFREGSVSEAEQLSNAPDEAENSL